MCHLTEDGFQPACRLIPSMRPLCLQPSFPSQSATEGGIRRKSQDRAGEGILIARGDDPPRPAMFQSGGLAVLPRGDHREAGGLVVVELEPGVFLPAAVGGKADIGRSQGLALAEPFRRVPLRY